MKSTSIIVMAVGLMAAVALIAVAASQQEMAASHAGMAMDAAKEMSMTGRLSCTFCTLAHPGMACSPDCCIGCVKAGDPPSLTDAQGNTFILLSGEKGVALMTADKLKMMGTDVMVKGTMANRNGIQAIYVSAMEKSEPKEVTLKGTLSCTFCTLAHPGMTCTPECCASCVKAGDPPALTDAQGNLYLLLTGDKDTPLMNPARLKLMGGPVSVKGTLVNKNGIRAIYVNALDKSAAK